MTETGTVIEKGELILVGSSAVIVAQLFNPSIFNQLWLVKHGIVREDEFQKGCIFTDDFAQIQTSRFQLIVLPPQLQLAPSTPDPVDMAVMTDTLGRIARALPETPYAALGLNFVWHLSGNDMNATSKRLFFCEKTSVFREFDTPDARFGSYMSKNWNGMRLKLDIKPVTLSVGQEEPKAEEHRIQLGFNYHHDLARAAKADEIEEYARRWSAAIAHTKEISQLILKDANS